METGTLSFKRKLACWLLSVVLVVGFAPMPSYAEEATASAGDADAGLVAATEGAAEDGAADGVANADASVDSAEEASDAPAIAPDPVPAAQEAEAISTDDAAESSPAFQSQDSDEDALIDISSASIVLSKNSYTFSYEGDDFDPDVTVTLDGVVLERDVDYVVTYENNLKPGTATAVVTGAGAYTGVATKNYQIKLAAPKLAKPTRDGAQVELVWNYFDGSAVFKVLRQVEGASWQTIATLNRASSYTDKAPVGKKCSYRIVAMTKDGVASAPSNVMTVTVPKASVKYRTHVQRYGWQNYVKDGASSGTSGKSLRLEGINIDLASKPYSGGITYRTHVQRIGWQGWKSNNAMSGTSGKSLRLEAIQIKLTGEMEKKYDVYYRVHAQHFGWMGWAKNGASAGTAGYSYRLEAIQIKLVEKGGKAPGSTANAFKQKTTTKKASTTTKKSTTSKASTTKSSASSQTVYYTPSGGKYHRASCSTLKRSKTIYKTTVAQAKASGRTACSVCKP